MKLWPLNNEFDIEIIYPNSHNFPSLSISDKRGLPIGTYSLANRGIKSILTSLSEQYPNSQFLNKIKNIQSV